MVLFSVPVQSFYKESNNSVANFSFMKMVWTKTKQVPNK